MGKCFYCNCETEGQESLYGYDGFEKVGQTLYCCCDEHKAVIHK